MNKQSPVGGSPPMLWPNRNQHPHITHHMDCGCSKLAYETRILKLSRQIERLSWMVEVLESDLDISLEKVEQEWQLEHASLI